MSLDRNDIDKGEMPMPANLGQNAISCHEHRVAGRLTFNPVTFHNVAGGNFFAQLFQVVGLVELKALYGVFTNAIREPDSPDHAFFVLHSGATILNLTDGAVGAGGADCKDARLGSTIAKTAALANIATFLNSDTCKISELTVGGSTRSFFSSLLLQENAVNTFIELFYTSDAAADFNITFVAIWACRIPGSYIIAV